jgi:hypothetical protein
MIDNILHLAMHTCQQFDGGSGFVCHISLERSIATFLYQALFIFTRNTCSHTLLSALFASALRLCLMYRFLNLFPMQDVDGD